jgi:hypothetical protein
MTFSISERIFSQHIVFTYLLQHTSTVQPVQRISKGFLQKYRPWQDSNQARATTSTPTRAMAPLTCELSYRIDVQLPSLICDPTIVKDLQKTPATVSLCDLQQLQKYFYQIMCSDPMETTTKYCILHRLCPMFPFASEERRI